MRRGRSPECDLGSTPRLRYCRPLRVTSDRVNCGRSAMSAQTGTDQLEVWVDQDLCTGDGLCVQYAPEVFEFDVDGLAYVKDDSGELQLAKNCLLYTSDAADE